ncbi:Abi family protein [Francisellaceae bacterium CB52]
MYCIYTKPYKKPLDLIGNLKAQKLIFADENKATEVLSNINYFRFKIYLRPLLNIETKQFKVDSSFESAYELYLFDENLKSILFTVISQIETQLRAKLDQCVTSFTNDPFWYINNRYFSNIKFLLPLKNEFFRSKDDFTKHYKSKYINVACDDYKEMPPFWIISELSTFGNILSILESIKKEPFRQPNNQNVLDDFAKKFGACNLKELNSWLHLVRDVRNRVAHHSRVWNCNYREPSGIKKALSENLQPSHPNTIYLLFVVLEKMYDNNILDIEIKSQIKFILAKYPAAKRFTVSMGIPLSWID